MLHRFMHSTLAHTLVTRSFMPMHTVNGIIFCCHSCLTALVNGSMQQKKRNIVVAIKAKPVCTAMSVSACFLCCFRFLFFCSLFFRLHFWTHYIRTCIIYIFEICVAGTYSYTVQAKWQWPSKPTRYATSSFIHSFHSIPVPSLKRMSCDVAWKIVGGSRTKQVQTDDGSLYYTFEWI